MKLIIDFIVLYGKTNPKSPGTASIRVGFV